MPALPSFSISSSATLLSLSLSAPRSVSYSSLSLLSPIASPPATPLPDRDRDSDRLGFDSHEPSTTKVSFSRRRFLETTRRRSSGGEITVQHRRKVWGKSWICHRKVKCGSYMYN
ncbi:hypothetical protein HPP92_020209 [Vanilla planifolia]|uniref:Uncharacterized protein n=1 Tax=Vanilla planifolia TaxID=51239 RepID=A0A835UKK1_VANPL|nr:hypothetical protein HPP92_020209 [Vanilla planifolia]